MIEDLITLKRCPRCLKEKNRDEDFFKRSGKKGHLPRAWCKQCEQELRTLYLEKHPENKKRWMQNGQRRYKYGLEPDEYERLLTQSNHSCFICKQQRKLCVDHDHLTGKIRGLLCVPCNTALAQFGDSVEGLQRAITYIEGGREELD
jgi:glutaredoxin